MLTFLKSNFFSKTFTQLLSFCGEKFINWLAMHRWNILENYSTKTVGPTFVLSRSRMSNEGATIFFVKTGTTYVKKKIPNENLI